MIRKERPNSGWTRVALLIFITLSCFLIIVGRTDVRENSAARTASKEAVAPLAALMVIPLRSLEGVFTNISERATAFEKNEALKAEIAILRERQVRYENLAMKVARYEAILGVDTETDVPLKKIAARAISESNGPFVRSLLLNVGRGDGVAFGNPGMSTDGLVGHIINVGPKSSRVLRLSDLNSRIPVASARSGATAILAGDNTLLPKLSFINEREDWRVGDRVISSGDDGALPRGLAIGEVVSGGDGLLRVELSSRENTIDWVWVSPYESIETPPDSEDDELSDDAEAVPS